jgi:transcriptional repressor NrdR
MAAKAGDCGVRCPVCASHSKVIDSRRSGDDEVRRRRECKRCGARFTTIERTDEMVVPQLKPPKRKVKG